MTQTHTRTAFAPFARLAAWLVAAVALTVAAAPAHAEPSYPTPIHYQPTPQRQAPPSGRGGAAPQPHAQEAPAGRTSVKVMVAYANRSGKIDPALADLKRQLEVMNLTGCQVLSSHDAQLALNQSTTVSLDGGRKIEVTLLSRDETQSRIQIEVFKDGEKKLDTTVSVRRGKTFAVAGPKYQEGVLIFPISVIY